MYRIKIFHQNILIWLNLRFCNLYFPMLLNFLHSMSVYVVCYYFNRALCYRYKLDIIWLFKRYNAWWQSIYRWKLLCWKKSKEALISLTDSLYHQSFLKCPNTNIIFHLALGRCLLMQKALEWWHSCHLS